MGGKRKWVDRRLFDEKRTNEGKRPFAIGGELPPKRNRGEGGEFGRERPRPNCQRLCGAGRRGSNGRSATTPRLGISVPGRSTSTTMPRKPERTLIAQPVPSGKTAGA
jgi:hypothetical protein